MHITVFSSSQGTHGRAHRGDIAIDDVAVLPNSQCQISVTTTTATTTPYAGSPTTTTTPYAGSPTTTTTTSYAGSPTITTTTSYAGPPTITTTTTTVMTIHISNVLFVGLRKKKTFVFRYQ